MAFILLSETAVSLLLPQILANYIDILNFESNELLIWCAFGYCLAVLFRGSISICNTFISETLGWKLCDYLRIDLFKRFEYYYAFIASLPDTVGKLIRGHKQSKVSIKRLHPLQYGACNGHAKFEQGKLEVEMVFLQKKHVLKVNKGEVTLIKGESESERSILLQRLFQICFDYLPEISCKYIPQQPVLFNASIVDNICFGEPYLKDKMTKVIEQTDLIVDIKEFGDGIHKTVGKQGTMVSGGQRKRISIARALYSGVDILFIDGLAEAVDKRTEKILVSNILEHPESIIFVSSNSESVIDKANQIIKC